MYSTLETQGLTVTYLLSLVLTQPWEIYVMIHMLHTSPSLHSARAGQKLAASVLTQPWGGERAVGWGEKGAGGEQMDWPEVMARWAQQISARGAEREP